MEAVGSLAGRTSTQSSAGAPVGRPRTAVYKHTYVQVLIAIALGILLGMLAPGIASAMKPLGDGFIKVIRMLIAPIVFTTVVVGVARMGDMKEVGRIGLKTLVYFEVITTLALILGLLVVNVLQPGAGMNVDPQSLDTKGIQTYTANAQQLNWVDFFLNIIPTTVFDAFTKGDVLQVLLFSLLFGAALSRLGERGRPLVNGIDQASHALFGIVRMLMYLAPIGAFGAIAFTVGAYGVGTLLSLGKLVGGVYVTSMLFIFLVLGVVARMSGFSIWKFLKYIKEEIFLIMGTTSAEIAMPRLMTKLENLGCSRPVVGLVVPTGYTFNLDGSAVYLTMAAVFIAQATNTPLNIAGQIGLLAVLMLTSKGAASVTGAGFVTLAATLSSTGVLPVAGLALLLGVDRFMSESRAVTNLIGNGVAGIVVARWEGALDTERMHRVLDNQTDDLAVIGNAPALAGAGVQQQDGLEIYS
ncbi:MAG: C4-dicarboxylate transporter DctC [Chloroflexota bacterium]